MAPPQDGSTHLVFRYLDSILEIHALTAMCNCSGVIHAWYKIRTSVDLDQNRCVHRQVFNTTIV